MSGYFVHGGTQYPYSQQSGQSNANVGDLSYQSHQSQSQFYQTTSYPVQSLRTTISSATKPTTNSSFFTSYNNQSVNQGFSSAPQTQTYSSNDTTSTSTNSGYNRQSTNSSYDGMGYNNGSFGSSPFSSSKANGKFGNSQFGSYKSGSVGSIGSAWLSSQPSQASYNTSYPQNTSYSKPMTESASSSQYSYEKALLVAANQYFMNKKAAENNRGGRINRGRGRGRGGVGAASYSSATSGPKPIKATEVKAYLYAWCGQRRLKPEYTIEPIGTPPKLKFSCTLTVVGLDYTAKVEAASKKDAQSKAAWDFCEHLVRTGYMKQMELPPKPVDPSPKSVPPKPSTPAGIKEGGDGAEEGGGWTIENCRQRLNQFTQRERIPAEFKHETLGPEHARTFLAELTLNVKWLKKEFVARERGSNKKQATAVCALSMVRQLYREGLIEKHGDPIKIPNRRQTMENNDKRKVDGSNVGMKRKAEEVIETEEIDECGNWTLEGSRQRLHMFCQATNQPFDIKYNDDGLTPPKNFTASVEIDITVDGKKQHLEQSATCQGKKPAAQKCALEMVKQLYNLSLVEPNIGIQQNKKKNPQRSDYPSLMSAPQFGFNMGPHRKTMAHDDVTIMEKHRRIYPTEAELSLIQQSVCDVEAALKKVSDDLIAESITEEESSKDDVQTKTDITVKQEVKIKPEVKGKLEEKKTEEPKASAKKESKRILQGVMRVEALAKGLLLKGDVSAHLVLLCTEIPTATLLMRISTLLAINLEETEKKYLVNLQVSDCNMLVTSPTEAGEGLDTMCANIKVSLTSPTMRSATVDLSKGPADMLNREKCIASLAELRHAKWFQACANGIPSCVVLLRVLRDLKRRNKTWASLSDWALELLVEKSIKTSFGQLSVGEALRRVLSCLSSGILLQDGPGLYDPCEKETTDVIENMTPQERVDITESAQHALRMLVFRQTYKLFGIEPMPVAPARMPRRYGMGPGMPYPEDNGEPVPLMDISM